MQKKEKTRWFCTQRASACVHGALMAKKKGSNVVFTCCPASLCLHFCKRKHQNLLHSSCSPYRADQRAFHYFTPTPPFFRGSRDDGLTFPTSLRIPITLLCFCLSVVCIYVCVIFHVEDRWSVCIIIGAGSTNCLARMNAPDDRVGILV
jgi:hypothetical protein